MKRIGIIVLLFVTASCQFFDTEKITSETFYEEEMKAIEWEEVDQYPTFSVCDQITEKAEQRECFTNTIKERLYLMLIDKNLSLRDEISDTVFVHFGISNSGELLNQQVIIDSTVMSQLPMLEQWLLAEIDSLPAMQPAHKRGIPVATEFHLPIVIKTESTKD